MSRLWSLVFLLVFSLNINIADTLGQYLLLVLAFFLSTVYVFSFPQKARFYFQPIDTLPLLMFLAWSYGVVIALYKGVFIEYVFKNFFGMALYPVYYFIIALKIDREKLFNSFFYGAVFNSFVAIYFFFVWFFSGQVSGSEGSIGDYRSYYSYGLMITVPLLALLFFCYISGILKFFSGYWLFRYPLVLYIFFSFSLIVTTMSKGFLLSFLVVHVSIFLLLLSRSFLSSKISPRIFSVFFVSILSLLVLVFSTNIFERVAYSFSGDESSNNIRNEQRKYLFDELTLEGAGLGSSLESGYKRDALGYGFELTYENLIHKLGLFSILPFAVYLITLYVAVYRIFVSKNIFCAVFSLGAMMYMIPSYGNPTLFSPTSVIFHIVAIYFLRNNEIDLFRLYNPSK